ncbi:glycosyltransferase family 2 protein [Algoriphagus zhangzhouensis]|uniref:Glycosyltransferase, GT2 family n=1 Tax=Algoriphagus zhangzhouensis TaxID=1073327 RepID=A0A1M7ZDK9_9BACT|nr:glycosyltransferase family 2 protein [Algoriphagus zhangzhouensis]TDY45832.1 GT2 family glycosyltransferase [Algoriphagus zhangzhouensis]SHO62967.1 Glycosyltransferase, GT2 family [Algoriphagus zhangzhouensis]
MDISIVLEWENAVLAELQRTKELLIQIFNQTNKRSETIEMLILHNEKQVSKKFIEDFIDEVVAENDLKVSIPYSVIDVEDAHYFELKNQGVKLAKGEKIIFLDSDIIPGADWLEIMLETHNQYPDSVVSGYSYIDYSDLVGKAFALSWFFPLPPVASKLDEVGLIFSNNYIANRQLMLENPYPEMNEGITRGADTLLWERMKAKGIKLYKHSGATASHPCPNGASHFFTRALAEGRDDYGRLFEKEFFHKNPFKRFFKIYLFRSKKAIKSSFQNGKRVDLKTFELPFTVGIMLVYYQFYFAGGLLTKLFPDYTKSSWRI